MPRVQRLRQLAVKSGRIRNMKHVTVRKEANVDQDRFGGTRSGVCPGVQPDSRLRPVARLDYPPIYVAPPRRF